ncbi:MAG: CDP-alcohol phosphatidyltransferase family protein, partial [Rhodospirillales bacterium]
MQDPPWDQRIARRLVRPLINTPITPNIITVATLILALAGALMFAAGDPNLANWGAGLFVLARFLDHFDGELARQSGKTSKLGYYLDYVSGAISYGALFLCL